MLNSLFSLVESSFYMVNPTNLSTFGLPLGRGCHLHPQRLVARSRSLGSRPCGVHQREGPHLLRGRGVFVPFKMGLGGVGYGSATGFIAFYGDYQLFYSL